MPTLSEAESKSLVAAYGVPVADERVVDDPPAAVQAAREIGLPAVVKLCGPSIAHKTERGLVRLGLADTDAVSAAAEELLRAARPEDGEVGVLVAPMLRGARELIAGTHMDPQFGPCVMVGVGGVLAEALRDVAFRLAPVDRVDAGEMLDELRAGPLLGPFRGEAAVDREAVAAVLVGLSRLMGAHPEVAAVDVNPLLIVDGLPIAADALVELRG